MLKLKSFRVTGFRSVQDSGWVEADTVTALIGTNESGKTNLLLPLWKLNPAKDGEIDALADCPRSEYSELRGVNESRTFIAARFQTSEAIAKTLETKTGLPHTHFDAIEYARSFDGEYTISFPNASIIDRISATEAQAPLLLAKTAIDEKKAKAPVRAAAAAAIDEAVAQLTPHEDVGSAEIASAIDALTQVGSSTIKGSPLEDLWKDLTGELVTLRNKTNATHPNHNSDAIAFAREQLPPFVYYSNYGNLDSEIYLPHVIENMTRDNLGAKEAGKARTLKVLFEFVGLQPDEILELGRSAKAAADKKPTPEAIAEAARNTKERSVLLQSAGTKLTKEFRTWWKQGDYRFRFEADGDHFRIWVADDRRPEEIELESRSTGLQWFLSFFLVFLVESGDEHRGAILLLDEPGLSLHPLAQKDLSQFFENLSQTNQLFYTTHSPFMVDSDRLDRVRSVYVGEDGSTAVSSDLRAGKQKSAEAKSVYAVHAALGLSVSDTLFQGCQCVIVEGQSDQHYFNAIKIILVARGAIKPKAELLFPPGGGVKGVGALVPVIGAKSEEPPYVILDSDKPGKAFASALRSGKIYGGTLSSRVLCIGDVIPQISECEVEDLVPRAILVDVVSRTIRGGGEEDFSDTAKADSAIIPQIEAYAARNGITLVTGWKVDLARAVKTKLLKSAAEIPAPTIEIWQKLFALFLE